MGRLNESKFLIAAGIFHLCQGTEINTDNCFRKQFQVQGPSLACALQISTRRAGSPPLPEICQCGHSLVRMQRHRAHCPMVERRSPESGSHPLRRTFGAAYEYLVPAILDRAIQLPVPRTCEAVPLRAWECVDPRASPTTPTTRMKSPWATEESVVCKHNKKGR
jgi:hypothetical protein